MALIVDIATFLIQTLLTFYLIVVLLRFLMQIARVDFYNPISQFVVKLTNPLVLPLRRLIPSAGGLDTASLALALLIQILATITLVFLKGLSLTNPLYVVLWGLIGIAGLILNIYFITVIASIIVSWVAPHSDHPAVLLLRQFTEPVLAPFRKLVPPIGGFDLSPIFLFIGIQVMQIIVSHAARATHLPQGFVLGY